MAYTPLNLGYTPTAGSEYSATTDSVADWASVPNNTYFFDLVEKQVFFKDSVGAIYSTWSGGQGGVQTGFDIYNVSSSQWNTILPEPLNLANGAIANGLTFFNDVTSKVAGGTTAYDEYNISFGITVQLSGTSGTANINVNGVNFLATFDTNLFTTANNWVTTNLAAINALGLQVFALGSGADGRIRFGALSDTILNAITITNVLANLSGTVANEFTGSSTASGDHIVVPYLGKPYFGKRILHTIRVNFNISVGSLQFAELGLYRYQNDTQIGSAILIQRNLDVSGVFVVIETYTASETDAFVTGGFYLALINNSGVTLTFINNAGILIQNIFDSPTSFIN